MVHQCLLFVVLFIVVSSSNGWLITQPSPPEDEMMEPHAGIAQRDIRKMALQNSELGKTLLILRQNSAASRKDSPVSAQPYSDRFWNSLLELLDQRKGATTEPPALQTARVTFAAPWSKLLYPDSRIALGPWIVN